MNEKVSKKSPIFQTVFDKKKVKISRKKTRNSEKIKHLVIRNFEKTT